MLTSVVWQILSRQVHEALNACQFDHAVFERVSEDFQHVNPDFSGFTDVGRGVMLLQDIMNARARMVAAHPAYRSVVTDSHTYIDENLRTAEVMLVIRHVGLWGDREEDGVQILRWKSVNGVWTCTKSTTMRCAPFLTDEITPHQTDS